MANSEQNLTQREEIFFMKFLVEELDAKTLPNKGDVLRNYFFLVNSATNKTKIVCTMHTFQKKIADEVVEKVLAIWSGLGISTTCARNCRENLEKLYTDYNEMKKSYREHMPTERQSVLDAWAEQCELLFFAEKRGARNECEPNIRKQLIDASRQLKKFAKKSVPYQRVRLRPRTKAKGPEAGRSHAAVTDANNNFPQSPSKNRTPAAPSPKRPASRASNDLASSEDNRRKAIAKPPGEAELAKSSTRTKEKIKHRAKKSEAKKDAKVSQADALRYYEEVMREVAEYDKRLEELEAREKQLTRDGCHEKHVEVDVESSRAAASTGNEIKLEVEAQHTDRALAIASSKKHAEAKSALTATNADGTPASRDNSLEHRRSAPKNDHEDTTTIGRKSANVDTESSTSSAKLAEKPEEPTDVEMLDDQGDSLDYPKEAAAINARNSTSTAVISTVKAEHTEGPDFDQVRASGGTADEKDDAKHLEEGENAEQQIEPAVEASPAKKHAEKQARSSEEIADAETPESQADSTSNSGPARKKSRLDTVLVEHDNEHLSDKEVPTGGAAEVDRSNSIRSTVNLELATKAHAPTAYDDPSAERNTAPEPPQQPPRNIAIDPKQEALLRAMHSHSSAPEAFRAQLQRARWPPKCAWSDHELLEAAIGFEYEAIVVVLLQEGARAWRDADTPRAFHRIVELGWTRALELCLARGARVAERDSAGNTALHVAFIGKRPEATMPLLARRLVDETSVSVANCAGISTWHLLCGPGSDASLVEAVLSRGYADVNAQVSSTNPFVGVPGYTALHVAVKYNQLETARVLLRHGANLRARNNSNSTPLHLAGSLGWVPMVDLLLSHDDCIDNPVDDYGVTHFMCACIGTRVERVKEFIAAVESQPWKSTIDLLESQTKKQGVLPGCTPLLLAKRFERRETVKLLLSRRSPDVQCDPIDAAPLPVPDPINAVISGICSVAIQIDDTLQNSRVLENL